MTEEPRTCPDCDYYSASYRACFNPATWHQGEFFKVPGDPLVWNPGGRCKMWEPVKKYDVHPVGRHMPRFLSRLFLRRSK